jgi:hypothetical protein
VSTVIVIEIYFNFFTQKVSFSPIPALELEKIYCDSPVSAQKKELLIYVTDATMGLNVADFLCSSHAVAKQFSNVVLVIGQTDLDTFKYINYGLADLALIKENTASAFNAQITHNLQLIGQYPDYEAFFIATNEKPRLEKDFFLDKRIGLLDYPTSRSGHIAPKSTFQALDINEKALDIQYFNSHSELREKLLSGEVDVIASYWSSNDEKTLSSSYITQIKQTFSGVRWYLKAAKKNVDLLCEVQRAITFAGKQHYSSYYLNPQWELSCPQQVGQSL